MNRLTLLSAAALWLAANTGPSPAAEPYQPDWESLGNYRVPEWYQDAKFGIWPHWGVYSVPAYRGDHAAEWYGRWMHCVEKGETELDGRGRARNEHFEQRGLKTAAFHRKTFDDPARFGYHDLAGLWKAEKWDPEAWAQLAVDAGAKFFCMMAMHHDSFALYGSGLTEWNSVDKGPQRDLCAEMKAAAHRRGLKFGVSNHMAWNSGFFSFYHRNGYAKLPGHEKLEGLYSDGVVDEAYLERWWQRTTEAVDKLEPDLYYFDWGWNKDPWREANYHARFAAHFYNNGIRSGKGKPGDPGVVLCAKRKDIPVHCAVRDLERRQMDDIQEHVWQTDTSISVHSWGYSTEDEYRSADQLIDSLVDIVSKNGVMMLNFGPKADGTVPEEYKAPLLEMGKWLEVNGEAIYATRPWVLFGEGPELENQRQVHDHTLSYTGKHIRFTRNKRNTTLYATALDWPGETMTITMLAAGRLDPATIQSVRLLGSDTGLEWKQTAAGLAITMPAKPATGHAYPVRIEFSGPIPALAQPE